MLRINHIFEFFNNFFNLKKNVRNLGIVNIYVPYFFILNLEFVIRS